MTDKILERPEWWGDAPQQARYVGAFHLDETEARELVQYFEGRIAMWEMGIGEITCVEKFTLFMLYRAHYYSALSLFVKDWPRTKLGQWFEAWDDRHG